MLEDGERWRVMQGDSLHLLRDLPDGCADLVLTDPPYSSGGLHRGDRANGQSAEKYVRAAYASFAGDSRDQRTFMFWCHLWMGECVRILRPGGIFATYCDWRQLAAVTDAIQVAGFVMRGVSVWDKPPGAARSHAGRPVQSCEFVVWGTSGERSIETGVTCGPGTFHGRLEGEKIHPTQKPLGMLKEWCELAPVGGLVLDPFAGSGSTGEAALLTGRRFLGVELTAHYASVARDRLAAIGEHGEVVSREQPSLFESAGG